MRDPLDPQNPYRGEYAPYDAWIYAHAWQQARSGSFSSASDQLYSIRVDSDGWPQPMHVTAKHDLCDDGHITKPHCYNVISAYGIMDQGMSAQQQQDELAVRAGNLPQIPAWLADQTPLQVMVLPDGEVVTLGKLGSAPDASRAGSYYRYSKDGVELGHTAPGAEWWTLYFAGFDALRQAHEKDSYWEEDLGCVQRFNSTSGQVRELYDYHGTRLPGVKPPPDRAPKDYWWLSGTDLAAVYAQQNGGTKQSA